MKKIIIISFSFLLFSNNSFGKKVKFSVDMTGIAISPFGMHITGDFQTLAGYAGGDWMPNNTPLTQEIGDTNIYSIVVDIPAFAKYEYKFVNGDQFYEAEFVPAESRVGYNFNDNRWLYIDSLADDTTFIGVLVFGGNAPVNKNLIRFVVNMQNETLSPNGVHVAGDFQSWNSTNTIMYHFDDAPTGVYEVISYVSPNNTYQYKYYNGNTIGDAETIAGSCTVGGNRSEIITSDIILNTVCFSFCSDCTTGSNELVSKSIKMYPNPTSSFAKIEFKNSNNKSIIVTDLNGKIVREYYSVFDSSLQIQKDNLLSGIYFVNVLYDDNSTVKEKLIFQ